MQAEVFWVPGPWRGRFAVVSRPRGGDWLDDETRAWREAAIDVVVSLLEPQEEADLALAGESTSARANRIEFRAYPIPDRGVPSSRESVARLASEIVETLRAGRTVAVHCRQGVGRSGLFAAAVLIVAGADPETAVTTIGHSRGIPVPETDEQRRWITDFASWLAEARAAQPAAATGRSRRRPSG